MVMLTAACASAPAEIPSAKPSPSAAPTTIAPGVRVNPSQLRLPPYSVSTSNPLPPGTSAKSVVTDVTVDNLIENVALERDDAALLQYSDSGDVLAIDQNQVSANKADGITILKVVDAVSSIEVGARTDPNSSAAQIALIVEGVETTTARTGPKHPRTTSTNFKILIWVLWSAHVHRYLQCDVSTLS